MWVALTAGTAIFAGATLQRTVGFGFSLLSLPVLVVVSPGVLPQSLLLLAIPLVLAMVVDGWRDIDLRGLGVVVPFQVVASWTAARALVALPEDTVRLSFGIATVVASVMLFAGGGVPVRRWTQAVCGTLSGIMGTGAGLAGPPLALLYADAGGQRLRSTLAASFLISDTVGLLSFASAGELRAEHLRFAGEMLLPLAVGVLLGHWTKRRIAGGAVRPAVLVVSGAGGAAVALMSITW